MKKLAEISEYPAMLPKAFQGIDVCELHPMIKKHEIVAKIKNTFDSYGVAIEMLANSDGWSLFPEWVLSQAGGKLVSLKMPGTWNAKCPIAAVYAKERFLSRVLSRLLETIEHRM